MEIPVTTDTPNDMCCSQNNWLTYMTLAEIVPELVDARFLVLCSNGSNKYYKMTDEGHNCLHYFHHKIPFSIRDEIKSYVKKNRRAFKKNQDYFKDYNKNKDGTYTVRLKITDPTSTKLELTLNVANRGEAVKVYKKWNDSASKVYADLYEILIDGD